MKIHFICDSSEKIGEILPFDVDWDCELMPRMGEIINSSIVMSVMTPKTFRKHLTHEAGELWDKRMSERPKRTTPEEHELNVMFDWIMDMELTVSNVGWHISGGEIYASIMLMEAEQIIKRGFATPVG